jgi:hypothetical protein
MFPRVALEYGQRWCARAITSAACSGVHDRRGGRENMLQMFWHLSSSSGSPPDTATWLPRDPAPHR